MLLWVWALRQALLTDVSLEPASDSVSPSLSAPPLRSLSLSKITIKNLKKKNHSSSLLFLKPSDFLSWREQPFPPSSRDELWGLIPPSACGPVQELPSQSSSIGIHIVPYTIWFHLLPLMDVDEDTGWPMWSQLEILANKPGKAEPGITGFGLNDAWSHTSSFQSPVPHPSHCASLGCDFCGFKTKAPKRRAVESEELRF